MSLTEDQLYEEALQLPDEFKVSLAERIVQFLETHLDSDTQRKHLDIAKRRRNEIRSGLVQPIHGEDALAQVRRIVNT